MRILHIISDRNIGGAGVLLLNLLHGFADRDIDNRVALPRGSALCPRLQSLGIDYTELDCPCDRFSTASVKELCGIIRREEIELVHTNAAISGRVAGRLCRIPVVHTRHCCFAHTGAMRYSVCRAIAGIGNRMLSDRVIATAQAAAENLCELGIPQSKLRVILNGSLEVRAVGEEEISSARVAWGLREGDYCIGICARLVTCKGHTDFLDAARKLLLAFPERPLRFLIAGEGPMRAELEERVRTLGIADAVRFLGFLSDPAVFYRLLRINVNCSTGTETSCLALSEGMSAGVPFVATDYGGNPAMLGNSDAGILYPAGNAHALANAIGEILSDPAREERMRRAAYARFRSCFTADGMAGSVADVYAELL